MHILVIPSYYPTEELPSTGIFFREQVEALHKANHKIGVIVAPRIRATMTQFRKHKNIRELFSSTMEESDLGYPIFRMHWGWFPRIFPRICGWLHKNAGLKAFEQYINQYGHPDIIHAHNIFYSGYIAMKIGQKYNIPVALTEHSSNFIRGRIFLPGQHAIAKTTLEGVEQIATVSHKLGQKLQNYVPSRQIKTISNIVQTDYFTIPDTQPNLMPFQIGVAGNLIPLKGYDLLLKAFAKVFKDREVNLRIAGSGAELNKLIQLSESLEINTQVTFLGRLNRAGIRDLMQKSHVIVSSSYVETFGVTLIEAMACGKPVIATRSGGPQEFVTEETGILIPTRDVDALANALDTIMKNYETYDPQHIRDYCMSKFSQEVIVKHLEQLYTQAIHIKHHSLKTKLNNPC